jgi:hypothetical protein
MIQGHIAPPRACSRLRRRSSSGVRGLSVSGSICTGFDMSILPGARSEASFRATTACDFNSRAAVQFRSVAHHPCGARSEYRDAGHNHYIKSNWRPPPLTTPFVPVRRRICTDGPHIVHTTRGPNDGTARSPARWSTFKISSCRYWWHWTHNERTPFSRMLASCAAAHRDTSVRFDRRNRRSGMARSVGHTEFFFAET